MGAANSHREIVSVSVRAYACVSFKYVDKRLTEIKRPILTRWKKDAKVCTVSVNHNDKRGYQSAIPKPVIEILGHPDKITFLIRPNKRVEVVAGTVATYYS